MAFFKKSPPAPKRMTNDRLGQLINELSDNVSGQVGYWQFNLRGRDLLTITDESHNRMRVMAPIAPSDQLDEPLLVRTLQANYDRALDAKYAMSDGVLWSLFTHPLGELTDDQFKDAVQQVATLADNFGTSYTSTDLMFGGQ